MDTSTHIDGERTPLLGTSDRQRRKHAMDTERPLRDNDEVTGWKTKTADNRGNPDNPETTGGASDTIKLNGSTNVLSSDIQHPAVNVRPGMLELVVVCFYTALVFYYPVIQQYMYKRLLSEQENASHAHHDLYYNKNHSTSNSCSNSSFNFQEAAAQKDTSEWLLYIGLANSIPGMFSTLVIGSITDNRGRKLGMVIPGVGAIVKISMTMLVIKLDWPLFLLLIGGFIDGCLGSFGATFTAAFAYLADITTPGKQRTWRITVLEGLMNLASSASSVVVGYFIHGTGYFYPLLASLVLFVFTLILIVFGLPETTKSQPEVPIFGCGRLFLSVGAYIKPRDGTKRTQLILLLTTYLILQMVFISKGIIATLFQMGFPFCWRSVTLGIYFAVGSVVQTGSMLLFLRPFRKCLHENIVAMIGTISAVGELTMTGLASGDVMLFLAPVAGFLLMIPSAMIKSVMSLLVGPDEQGALFAGVSSVQLVCYSLGTSVFNQVYGATVSTFPGLTFLIMAGITFLTIFLLWVVEVLRRKDKRSIGYNVFTSDEAVAT